MATPSDRSPIAYLSVPSPVGTLTVFADPDARAITILEWGRADGGLDIDNAPPVLQAAAVQLSEYFDGKRKTFDLPTAPDGTPHQQAVWRAMAAIPYGQTQTYGEIAKTVGSAPRAIGTACGKNPIPIILPCHRVMGRAESSPGFPAATGSKPSASFCSWKVPS